MRSGPRCRLAIPAFPLVRLALLFVVCLFATWTGYGQTFQVSSVAIDASGGVVLKHPADPAFYYILYRGAQVTRIVSATDMALGVSIQGELHDQAPNLGAAFYRVRQVVLVQPLDTDGDGIDDVWELRFRRAGAALNPNDANEDHTGSGSPDLVDYQLPVASFNEATSTVIAQHSNRVSAIVLFSRPFTGKASLLLGGTAVHGEDFLITGFAASNQTAHVTASGATANFEIILLDAPGIDPDRYLLLSILEPAATNAPTLRYQTSQHAPANHRIRITEGDLGIYTGILEFTNQAALGSQPVRLALRSGAGGGVEAYLDATQSSFFRQGLMLPASVSPAGVPLGFPGITSGQLTNTALQRTVRWTLQFGAATNTQDTVEAPASLQLDGLSASGQAKTARGFLHLVRINTTAQ